MIYLLYEYENRGQENMLLTIGRKGDEWMSKLMLHNLHKTFSDGTIAVRNLSIKADEKRITVLAGPAGSGKSSIFRLIMGADRPDQGTVTLDDKSIVYGQDPGYNAIMISENYTLYPRMTVAQNMAFGLKIEHMDKEGIQNRVTQAASLLGIEDILANRAEELSNVEKFWVVMGRAVCRQPAVYLLDDPLRSLNPDDQLSVCRQISAVQKKLGTVVLFATRDCRQAQALEGNVVVLRDGGIAQSGTAEDISQNPHNMFVASFFSSPPLNLVDVLPHIVDGELYFLIDHKGRPQGNYAVSIRAEEYFSKDLAQEGRELTVGIRPDGIRMDRESLNRYADCVMEATVEEVERTPWHCLILLDLDGHKLVMKAAASCGGLEEGDVIPVALLPDRMLLFDKLSGKTLLSGRDS